MIMRSGVFFTVIILMLSIQIYAQEKSFNLVSVEYPPLIGEDLPGNGWTMDVARAALEPQGYRVSIRFVSWPRAVHDSKIGTYDGLYLPLKNREREADYLFSEPITQVKTGFLKLKNIHIRYVKLEDLNKYTIGTLCDYSYSPEFDMANYLKKEEVCREDLNFRKLLSGRIDLMAVHIPSAEYLMNSVLTEEEISKIEFMDPPLSVSSLYLAVSRVLPDAEQRIRDFNRGLERIRADGTFGKILEKHGFKYQH